MQGLSSEFGVNMPPVQRAGASQWSGGASAERDSQVLVGSFTGRLTFLRTSSEYRYRSKEPDSSDRAKPGELDPESSPFVTPAMIHELVKTGRIAAARRLLEVALAMASDRRPFDGLAAVLAPPRTETITATSRCHPSEIALLHETAAQHPGLWVAVADGTVVGIESSLTVLVQSFTERGLSGVPTIHRVPR